MTAKQYLSQGRQLQDRIRALKEAQARAYSRATSVSAEVREPVRGGKKKDKTDTWLSITERLEEEQEQLAETQLDLINTIQQVKENLLATVLIEYYINGRTWEQVAETLHYSESYTRGVLHGWALQRVAAILEGRNNGGTA